MSLIAGKWFGESAGLPLSPERAQWILDNGSAGYLTLDVKKPTYRALLTENEKWHVLTYWKNMAEGNASINDVIRMCARQREAA